MNSFMLLLTMMLVCCALVGAEREDELQEPWDEDYEVKAGLTLNDVRHEIGDMLAERKDESDTFPEDVEELLMKISDNEAQHATLKGYSVEYLLGLRKWSLESNCLKASLESRKDICSKFKRERTPVVHYHSLVCNYYIETYFIRSLGAYCWSVYRKLKQQCDEAQFKADMRKLIDTYGETLRHYFTITNRDGSTSANNYQMTKDKLKLFKAECKSFVREFPVHENELKKWHLDYFRDFYKEWHGYFYACQDLIDRHI